MSSSVTVKRPRENPENGWNAAIRESMGREHRLSSRLDEVSPLSAMSSETKLKYFWSLIGTLEATSMSCSYIDEVRIVWYAI